VIEQAVIEQIRDQSDIVDVIGEVVALTQRGNNHIGLCPFLDHNDTDASFSVSQSKQFYKCFGCGRGGNVFTFLMDYHGMTFPESVRKLGDDVGIEVKYDGYDGTSFVDNLYDINKAASDIYFCGMSDQNVTNLFAERGLSQKTIDKYRLGYCSGSWKASESGFSEEVVEQSGLFVSGADMVVREKLVNRYVFPFIAPNGKAVGFASTAPGLEPKYLNSAASKIYDKASFLYGLYQAKDSIKKRGGVILVEGYFDCLSMVQAGFGHTVAVCGTAVTEAHAKLLKRYTNSVMLFFDGDDAGRKAIDRAFPVLFQAGLDVWVANIWDYIDEDNEDPDSLINTQGLGGVEKLLRSSFRWWELVCFSASTADEKTTAIRSVKTVAEKLSGDRREIFLNHCAECLGYDDKKKEAIFRIKDRPERWLDRKVPKAIEDNELEALFLVGLLQDKRSDDDSFCQVSRYSFDNDDLRAIKGCILSDKEGASLFDGLTSDQAAILSYLMEISDRVNVDTVKIFKQMSNLRKHRERVGLVRDIAAAEAAGDDCSEYVKRLMELDTEGVTHV